MLLRCGLLMARTHINDRDCLPIRTARPVCVPHRVSIYYSRAGMYLDGVSRQEPTERIDGEGETGGSQPQPVSDIPSISTLYPKISLNLLLACLPISQAHP